MSGTLTPIADPAVRAAFREWLLRTADDELVIGHRHSEWTGFGPDIESDVAMSSIAQEEIGHARAFYGQISAGEENGGDHLAFGRAPAQYLHAILTERENDGWESSILRLVLYERYEAARLRWFSVSGQDPVAGLAKALLREERYHALFADAWLTRMSRGSDEGRTRVQAALDALWPDALGLFEDTEVDAQLLATGILQAPPDLQRQRWEAEVRPVLDTCGLTVPASAPRTGGRRGRHTSDFDRLHAQLTEVWRSDPEARW
ncbi:MAG TPA: 1,2-phenylacetyl-CoA epoxidase subunit PaaC [bacterium]|nr:1,2-phenylacetyl-CoA epoxidase subunit PaaC [bacterium]